jgi:hypothetical protein
LLCWRLGQQWCRLLVLLLLGQLAGPVLCLLLVCLL